MYVRASDVMLKKKERSNSAVAALISLTCLYTVEAYLSKTYGRAITLWKDDRAGGAAAAVTLRQQCVHMVAMHD